MALLCKGTDSCTEVKRCTLRIRVEYFCSMLPITLAQFHTKIFDLLPTLYWVEARLSQSPSLPISGSGIWPQCEGLAAPQQPTKFTGEILISSCRFYLMTNGFTDAPSIRFNHATWNVTWSKFFWTVYILQAVFWFCFNAWIQIQSFSGRFIFLFLRTFTKAGFSWQSWSEKTLPTCFVLGAHTTKFFFCFLAYANLATILMYLNSTDEGPKCLETELTNITRRHFCSLNPF